MQLNYPARIAFALVGLGLVAGEVVTWVAAVSSWGERSFVFQSLFFAFCIAHFAIGALWLVEAGTGDSLTGKHLLIQVAITALSIAVLWVMICELHR